MCVLVNIPTKKRSCTMNSDHQRHTRFSPGVYGDERLRAVGVEDVVTVVVLKVVVYWVHRYRGGALGGDGVWRWRGEGLLVSVRGFIRKVGVQEVARSVNGGQVAGAQGSLEW